MFSQLNGSHEGHFHGEMVRDEMEEAEALSVGTMALCFLA
ncbi:hypothetical protein EES41_00005 [Streptomyces sp. ADI95-16]|nr:hypothetical protein EES41_00005 [Streptomyces sp. ADI95-16]